MRLGRKYTGGPKKDPTSLKKETHCAACGEKGHWRGDTECKVSGKGTSPPSETSKGQESGKGAKKGPHQTYLVRHAEHGSLEVVDEATYGTMFSINVVFDVRRATDGDVDFSGLMILDTACQRTCCGSLWATSHASLLRAQDLPVYRAPCTDAFQFGSGDPVKAKHRLYMPAGIGGTDLAIGAGVLEANIPLLASNQLLDQLGLVLDMPKSSATFTKLGVTVPVQRNNGHLTVSVVEFSKHVPSDSARWQKLQDAVDWDSPPPELVFLAQAVPDLHSSAVPALHARDPTDMASRMAPASALPSAPQAQRVHPDGACGEPRPPDARDLPGLAPGARCQLRTSRGNLQPPRLCPVRQRVRQVRPLQAVPEEMEVERPRRPVGRTPGQQVRGIAAQFATALAILLQYCAGRCSTFQDGGTIDPSAFEAPGHNGQGIAGDTYEDFDNPGTRTQQPRTLMRRRNQKQSVPLAPTAREERPRSKDPQ